MLLVEAVLNTRGWGPAHAALLSLTMLVQTNGREHTEAEYCITATAARPGATTTSCWQGSDITQRGVLGQDE